MIFKGFVIIVKRKKILHCGVKVRMSDNIKIVSACNTTWNMCDETYEAESSEVTCKRCLKILEKADKYGKIKW